MSLAAHSKGSFASQRAGALYFIGIRLDDFFGVKLNKESKSCQTTVVT